MCLKRHHGNVPHNGRLKKEKAINSNRFLGPANQCAHKEGMFKPKQLRRAMATGACDWCSETRCGVLVGVAAATTLLTFGQLLPL
jgi:hypothetical protein